MERGYIKEVTRHYTAYWVTMGSATADLNKAGIFTRAEFESLHPTTQAALQFIPVQNDPSTPLSNQDKSE